MENFRQAVESLKSWNLMRYFCPKNTFLQLKHIQWIYPTLLSTTCVKIHQMTYVIFETVSHFWWHNPPIFLAQTLHTFYKSSLSKWKLSDLPVLILKFIKFLMSFLEPRVSFSSNFASFFSVMRHNVSVLFHLNIYMLWTNGSNQSANFGTFNYPSVSWHIIPLKFSNWNSICFGQKEPINVQFSDFWVL